MKSKTFTFILLLLVMALPIGNASAPGTFFWKPRLGIDLVMRTTEPVSGYALHTRDNIEYGLVVVIDTFALGMAIVAIVEALYDVKIHLHRNPISAYYHTNVYRWFLRHLSLLPRWIANRINYVDTHKVWRKRFYHMDSFVPKWLRPLFFYVDKREWSKEEKEYAMYKKFIEPAFGRHYRYPSKVFNNFKSEESFETFENMDTSSEQDA